MLVLALVGIGGCEGRSGGSAATLHVCAAASLADAFGGVGRAFEARNPGVRVVFSFGGSNQLRTQLENGGPGDVFASADRKQMDLAAASNVVDSTTMQVFAHNRLALIVPRENRAGIRDLADLARPGLKVVVADKAVPVGNYTRRMLEQAGESRSVGPGFVKQVEANIVSREENVAAVVAKVALNEADAGIAYASDAAGGNGAKLTVIELPAEFEQRAEYLIAVTARSSAAKPAARFVEFVCSGEGAGILETRGFMSPTEGSP
ncbi:MAG: molybdate ABC transporter substrate-binding protein [Phycisphaerales bacterium]